MGYFIRNTDNFGFVVNDKDLIGLRIMEKGYWEPEIKELYDLLVNKNYVVINIGANLGYHSINLANISSKVIAFEPQKKIFNQLCSNIYLNDFDEKIDAYQLALGDFETTLNMTSIEDNKSLVDNANITNYGGFAIIENGNGEKVNIKTLDSFNLSPDFILMDAEGYEFKILKGSLKTLSTHKPTIIFESWYEELNIFLFLNSIGYKIYHKTEIGYNYVALHPGNKDYIEKLEKLKNSNFYEFSFSYDKKEITNE